MKYYIVKMVEFDFDNELTQAQVDKLVMDDISKLSTAKIGEKYDMDFKYGVCVLQNEKAEKEASELFEKVRAFGQL